MTTLAASDKGIPLAFGNSPLVGLGLYRSITAVWVTEIGTTLAGLTIYVVRRVRKKKPERAA